MDYKKPIPVKTQDNKPYWDAADDHEMMVQRCDECDQYAHPPGPSCAKCGGTNLSWQNLGSDIKGTVYTYIISYRPFLPGFQDDLPLIIAQVEIEEIPDVKILANVLDCEPEKVEIGMPVRMVWQDINDERALPQWKPIAN
ncbi:hypothetical protein GWK91_10875 [Virgibacillus sp. MSP4-1]|uniref:Zn-ribbon domain-containing OB-fold protein n=1 Tax=Virgibacillus sp. MSP4-1 TaxID=2700081 RepID=UPI0005C54D72|nr:OB-fold domain-containing protein [Virgibacillus sp. MSP4-1]QHS23426.1 hypothetical protein GWK91_10875 [Virgibacillus sp. MSP4-1]